MSKTIPTTFTDIEHTAFFAGRPITAEDWENLLKDSNYIYQRTGTRTSLLARKTGWATASGSQTITDGSGRLMDLDLYQAILRPRRAISGGAFVVRVLCFQVDVEVEILFQDPTGTYADKTLTLTATGSSLGETIKGLVTFTAAEGAISWHVSIVGALSISGTAELWGISVHEDLIVAADLP